MPDALRRVTATRYVTPLREGGSLPGLVEADDDGLYVVKFRGAGQGPGALVAEVLAGELARALGLRVPDLVDERTYLQATEQVIRERARTGDAVILGRAAAVVLQDEPRALHVRLDGAEDLRLEQAMALESVDRETAKRHMRETDRAREAYVQQFYGVDARDASIYDLVIDSTVIGLDACVELIALAAADRAS